MSTDNKTEKALHAWRDALDRWYQEKLSDLQELAAFRTYGARQSKTRLEYEPARPTPLMQECLDYAEEKAWEYQGRKIYHTPVATASQAAAERIREYLRSKTQGAGVTGLLGADEDGGGPPKGASSFDFPEKKPKILCPRCGDRPWPTAKPFDETDLNCPACGSRELERVE